MNDPDYIVVRDPELPISGMWYDRTQMRERAPGDPQAAYEFHPTPFIEVREDGAVAQVWMRRPSRGVR